MSFADERRPRSEESGQDDSDREQPPPSGGCGCGGCGCFFGLLFVLLVGFVALLPTLASLPAVRGVFLNSVLPKTGFSLTVGDVSIGWMSPVAVKDIQAGPVGAERPIVSIKEVSSDRGLFALLWGSDWGTVRIVQPEVNLELDRRPAGVAPAFGTGAPPAFVYRPLHLEVTDASITVRGKDSPEPWRMAGLQLFVDLIPASASPAGVPTLKGHDTTLLNKAELTPEMCNDLLKFVAPVLASTTRSSGHVSLVLNDFTWPLGVPAKANLKGQLTLHEVSAGPGPVLQNVIQVLAIPNAPDSVRLAKDNVVDFSMHDGRVYHENLAFGLADVPGDQLIHTRGSVGLDETLDLHIDLPPLGGRLLPEGPLRDALSKQRVDLHVTGTLSRPIVKLPAQEGQAGPALKALGDWLEQRGQAREGQPAKPLFPNRKRADASRESAEPK